MKMSHLKTQYYPKLKGPNEYKTNIEISPNT